METVKGPIIEAALAPLALRVNVTWTFVGKVVYAASQWGMLVVLAKAGSVEMVGHFALGLAVGAPVFMFSNLQLRGIQATDALQEYGFADYLSLRAITTTAAVVVVAVVAFAGGFPLEVALVVGLIGIAKGIESMSDVIHGHLQHSERMDRIAKSLLIRGPLSLVALGVALVLTGSLAWAVAALALSWLVVLLVYDVPSGARLGAVYRPHLNRAVLRRLAWLALPLGLVMMFISLNVNIPRYLIELELGSEALGIFAALSYVIVAGSTVVAAVGQSAAPRLSKLYASGRVSEYGRLLLKLVAIGLGLGLAGVVVAALAGEPLLGLVYTAEYAAHNELFVALMAIATLMYAASFLGYAMTAARYFRVQLPIFATTAAITFAVGWWAIPLYGLYGAVGALTAALLVQGGASAFVIRYAMRSRLASPIAAGESV